MLNFVTWLKYDTTMEPVKREIRATEGANQDGVSSTEGSNQDGVRSTEGGIQDGVRSTEAANQV